MTEKKKWPPLRNRSSWRNTTHSHFFVPYGGEGGVCEVSNKNFVEEVITQIALIGSQNFGAYCVTVAWPSQRPHGERALSDWGRKLEPTHPWAIFQLNSDFVRNKILLILKAWVLLLILTVLRLIKAPSRLFAEK